MPADRIEAVTEGGMVTGGVSVRGVCTSRRVLGAALATGDDTDAVVGVGVGAAEVNWDFAGCAALELPGSDDFSGPFATCGTFLWGNVFVAASISRVPGTGRFSFLATFFSGELLFAVFPVAFLSFGVFAGWLGFDGTAGVTFGVEPGLEESRAGKSSSCKTRFPFEVFEDCDAISLLRPLFAASSTILFLASVDAGDDSFFDAEAFAFVVDFGTKGVTGRGIAGEKGTAGDFDGVTAPT